LASEQSPRPRMKFYGKSFCNFNKFSYFRDRLRRFIEDPVNAGSLKSKTINEISYFIYYNLNSDEEQRSALNAAKNSITEMLTKMLTDKLSDDNIGLHIMSYIGENIPIKWGSHTICNWCCNKNLSEIQHTAYYFGRKLVIEGDKYYDNGLLVPRNNNNITTPFHGPTFGYYNLQKMCEKEGHMHGNNFNPYNSDDINKNKKFYDKVLEFNGIIIGYTLKLNNLYLNNVINFYKKRIYNENKERRIKYHFGDNNTITVPLEAINNSRMMEIIRECQFVIKDGGDYYTGVSISKLKSMLYAAFNNEKKFAIDTCKLFEGYEYIDELEDSK
jgi:hypothetical protein